ncbi:MAG TPA: choice-of-anchor Q domain-containing protein [Rhodanobacteraceae bacterium]|nr:choice-of-anchor Q domain-containing protein [Rhodanobacteraceae bacterium]
MKKQTFSAVALRRRPLALCLAALCAGALPMPTRAFDAPTPHAPHSITVTNCDDSGPGSLRDAAANAADGDEIDLFQLDCSTISLTTGAIVTGQASLTLVGPGRDRLTIDGSNNEPGSALFYHLGSGQLLLENMTLTHGSKYRSDVAATGGCVHAEADVQLVETDVHDCTASSILNFGALGGAVWAGGNAILRFSTISGNAAVARGNGYASGGAVYANAGVIVEYATLSDNDVRSYSGTPTFGGAVFTHGGCYVVFSAIVRNHAKRMGGIAISDRYASREYIVNSTIAENAADYIGGIYSNAPLIVANSTVASNTATHGNSANYQTLGVGIHIGPQQLGLYSTLVSNNTAFGDYGYDVAGESGAVVVGSNNLVAQSPLALPGDTIRTPALLGGLADYGGITPTEALLPGSPGIDAGRQPPDNILLADQRARTEFVRAVGAAPDIGAFETQADTIFTTDFEFGPIAPSTAPTFPPGENFDELLGFVPALPVGWNHVHSGVGAGWSTIESDVFSQPIAAFADDVASVSDSSLETPSFRVGANAQLSFLHQFKLEVADDITGYDGVVLEIAIDGGAFADIVDAGGTFVGGGYNRTISDGFENPLALRQAWSGNSDGYHTVVVNLPAAANGHDARVRWRIGTDRSDRVQGYWLDNVHVDAGTR